MWFESCDLLGEGEFCCPTGHRDTVMPSCWKKKRADTKKVELFIIEGASDGLRSALARVGLFRARVLAWTGLGVAATCLPT